MPAAVAISNNTSTALACNTENFDTDTLHDNSTNNSRITVPSAMAGTWLFGGYAVWASNNTGQRAIFLVKNGTTIIALHEKTSDATTPGNRMCVVNALQLTAGDYIELYVYQNSGGNLDITDANFWGIWLGPAT